MITPPNTRPHEVFDLDLSTGEIRGSNIELSLWMGRWFDSSEYSIPLSEIEKMPEVLLCQEFVDRIYSGHRKWN